MSELQELDVLLNELESGDRQPPVLLKSRSKITPCTPLEFRIEKDVILKRISTDSFRTPDALMATLILGQENVAKLARLFALCGIAYVYESYTSEYGIVCACKPSALNFIFPEDLSELFGSRIKVTIKIDFFFGERNIVPVYRLMDLKSLLHEI